ncbi:MAG: substrate-binding domain-containing protein [Deltaproteobacteria bacterium]|nr:substrate-binding domain-containing protein [Deltaproteobacteria bacterium]
MKKLCVAVASGILAIIMVPFAAPGADKVIKMSTTTSTQASGLLDVLLPEFTKDTGTAVKVYAKGTGAAIRDGIDGNVDVIFVHAKAREEKFVAEGWGTKRYAVMHNDFVILGPPGDPVGIKGMTDAPAALKKIALAEAKFVSRGDDSGTHTKELALWEATGLQMLAKKTTLVKKGKEIELTFKHPVGLGKWYLSIGQGMGKVIIYADEKGAYTLADRGTYIKYKFGRKEGLDLEVLCQGDPLLHNPYGVIPVNPGKHPHVKLNLADQFARWLVSQRGQGLIADYKLLGRQLFYPDAIPQAK